MKKVLIFYITTLLLLASVYVAHAGFMGGGGGALPVCANGKTIIFVTATGLWTCADLSGGGDMTAAAYASAGKITAAAGGTGLDSSALSGFIKLTDGTWAARSAAEMRQDLAVRPGTETQAYSSVLDTYASITPTANAQTILGHSFSQMRTDLSLVPGTNVQAHSDVLDTYASITPTANAQTLLGHSFSQMKSDLSLNNVENTALSTWVGSANITTLGTISTGVWQGTVIGTTYLPPVSPTSAGIAPLSAEKANKVLKTDADGIVDWRDDATGGNTTFETLQSGTNVASTMTCGTGCTLGYANSGIIDASRFRGVTSVDATEFGYLNGVTGALQVQLDAKAPLINPTFTGDITATTFHGNVVGGVTGAVTGNASTATALAANGSNCSAGYAALGVGADGAAEGCWQVTPAAIGAQAALTNPMTGSFTGIAKCVGTSCSVASAGTDYVVPAGNVATASALAANGANCSAGQAALGVNASGAAEGCWAVASATAATTVNGQTCTLGSTCTVTASLPSNPAACATGQYVTDIAADGTLTCSTPAGSGDLKADGSVPLTADWNMGAYIITVKGVNISQSATTAGYWKGYELSGNGTNSYSFQVPDSITSDITFTYSATAPTAGQVRAWSAPSSNVSTQSWVYPALSGTAGNQVTVNTITSGGLPYGSALNTLSSTAALTAHGVVVMQGAGNAPVVVTDVAHPTYALFANTGADPAYRAIAVADLPLLTASKGGTGVANNDANTITFAGGNYPITLTLSGSTNVTFPTSGTLLNSTATGVQTFLTTPSLANLGSMLTDEGTGVITALGNAVNSTGGFITYGSAAGTAAVLTGLTPASGSLSDSDTILQGFGKLMYLLTLSNGQVFGRYGDAYGGLAIDGDLSSVSTNDDTLASAKATKAMGDLKLTIAPPSVIDGSTDITLTAAQMSDPRCSVTNYNMSDADHVINLPTAAANLSCLFSAVTARSHKWGVQAGASDLIYLIAADGTIAKGSDNGYARMTAAQDGQAFACWSIPTGASAWDWQCKAIAIGTSTFAAN